MTGIGAARRVWRALFGGLLVLAIVHSVAWYVVTDRLKAGVPAFVSAAAEQGWRMESLGPERTGWPWMPALRLSGVVATRPLGNTFLRWTAERVDLTISFLDLKTLWIVPAGKQTVEVPPQSPVTLRAGDVRVRVPLLEGRPMTLGVRDLAVDIGTDRLQVRQTEAEIAGLTATVAAEGVVIRPPLPTPFDGPGAGSMRATSRVAPGAETAEAWRSAGGRVEVPELSVRWGPVVVTGTGTGGLDAALQPEGQARLQVDGGMALLDALGRAGVIGAGPASAARAVLGLLTLASGGQPVSLPVMLADRTVTIAQFPLLRLPRVNWNGP